tara:strand:- start:142089 stop:142793 length:705 start_codon:yes stop_codon:yes gene_type:complete
MKDSKAYYNSIANIYDEQTKQRIAYLDAVDNIIIDDRSKSQITNYLDIGSGNGRRGLKIAKALNIDNLFLLDNSDKMLKGFSPLDNVKTVDVSIFDFNTDKKFDFITCLWNVIGHFPSKETMLIFFSKVNDLLSDKGVFIFDVNNRYNANHYGHKSVMINMQKDYENIKDAGWFILGNDENKTQVYVHSPFDIHNYLKYSGLALDTVFYVDYKTGHIKESFLEGQLVYKLRKKK